MIEAPTSNPYDFFDASVGKWLTTIMADHLEAQAPYDDEIRETGDWFKMGTDLVLANTSASDRKFLDKNAEQQGLTLKQYVFKEMFLLFCAANPEDTE